MRAYNYLLFRVFRFYTDVIKEKEIPLIYVAAVSSTLVYLNFYSLYIFLENKGVINKIINSVMHVVIFMFLIFILNFYFFVKRKKFLEYGFKKDFSGGILVI